MGEDRKGGPREGGRRSGWVGEGGVETGSERPCVRCGAECDSYGCMYLCISGTLGGL